MAAQRVLVIEDESRIAEILRKGLSLRGYEVEVALSGGDGRDAWLAGSFDIVLLDVMLPEINGIDLLVERRGSGDRTPVILLTARDDDQVRERGRMAGADALLLKPFAYAELLDLMESVSTGPERIA